jgi:hypothetical protein
MQIVAHEFLTSAAPAQQPGVAPTRAGDAVPDAGTGPGFRDMLAALNPLQGLPVIGAIYRHVTGDVPHPAAQVVGSLIFGGPIGLMLGALTATFEQTTGKTPVQMAMDAISPGRPDPGATTLAEALMPAEPESPPVPPASMMPAQVPLQAQALAMASRPANPAPARPARMAEPQSQPAQTADTAARPRASGGRDLAFYQAHAGARLPPAGATGTAPVQLAGLSPPRLLPPATAPARDDAPSPARPARPAPTAATAAATAALATSDAPQAEATPPAPAPARATQDFSARMLEGLERYRAMSRGAEARGQTVTLAP